MSNIDLNAGWRSPELGQARRLRLDQGELECFDRGEGPVLVFAHGWLANANLWRNVVARLAGRFRCIALDLPLGSHRHPLGAHADLTPEGCADLIADALDALELTDVTLVGNDSGGAYSQIALARRPGRIARLALTSCETPYDEFPPPPFDGLPALARDPAALGELLGALRDPAVRTLPAAYGLLAKRMPERRVADSYALPCSTDDEILRDTARAMSGASSESVRAAADRLIERFEGPVLLAWSREDPVFPVGNAQRYAEALKDARVELIDDAYSFTPEDQPERLADAIARFASVEGRG